MSWVNRWIARSGRWRGPYTVKNRRRAHSRACREVQHDRHAVERQRIAHNVRLDEPKAFGPTQPVEVSLLHGAGIEGIEVIDAHDLVTPGEKRFAHVRADEPGCARDEQ